MPVGEFGGPVVGEDHLVGDEADERHRRAAGAEEMFGRFAVSSPCGLPTDLELPGAIPTRPWIGARTGESRFRLHADLLPSDFIILVRIAIVFLDLIVGVLILRADLL